RPRDRAPAGGRGPRLRGDRFDPRHEPRHAESDPPSRARAAPPRLDPPRGDPMNACDVGRERVHAHFDEVPDAPASESLRLHLQTCRGCRELFDDLAILRDTLRARPRPELPADDLEAVWNRTVRTSRGGWLDGRKRAAVAAILVTGVSLST